MRTVDGVTALEGYDIGVIGKSFTNFRRSLAGEVTDRKVQTSDLSTHVITTTFGGYHERTGMFDFRCSVTFETFQGFVGGELVGEFDSGNGTVTILEKDSGSRSKVFIIGIKDHRKTKDKSIGQFHVFDNGVVGGFVHESSDRGESTIHDKFDIAKLTRSQLKFGSAFGNSSFLFFVRLDHKIDERTTMRSLLGSLKSRVGMTEGRDSRNLRSSKGNRSGVGVNTSGGEGSCRGNEKGSSSEFHGFC
mmetsp:Transcript_26380/g.40492  ORF Transcript_26380/g.40492 Transcript_26380/m.40492 type:complete len:247 (-) Transcript_26380:73-813(-)